METITNFFNHPFFIWVGGASSLVMICGFIYTAILVVKGVLPVWYKLGIGLSKGTIAVFALTEFESLRSMLVDSKVFNAKNIVQVNKNDMDKAKNEKVFLVHWNEYKDKFDDILRLKNDSTALIIYAPPSEGRIEDEIMDKINSKRNSVVVNFRGRLLSDILTSLITTSYERS